MDPSSEIRFDGWTLLRRSGELLRDGRRVRLQEQPRQVLEELLARPGELVTREQLIARLWPAQVVDFDTALNAAVRRLRAALGDEADTPRYIETIPRRGYRFVGNIEPPAGAAVETSVARTGRGTWIAIAAAAVAVGVGIAAWYGHQRMDTATPPAQDRMHSIVVLPFLDLSPEQDQTHLTDGVTEELIHLLSRIDGLQVMARTSSFAFKGTDTSLATIAERLNVTHVLEGSARSANGRLRVTARLIDARSGSELWSRSYDNVPESIFEMEQDIVLSVAGVLEVDPVDLPAPKTGIDARAHERLLLARFFFQRRAPGDMELARQYFEEALGLDPDYALAWEGLASSLWILTTDGKLATDDGLARLRDAAERALALDPRLAVPHLRLANYYWAVGDPQASREHRRQATETDPDNWLVISFAAGAAAEEGRLEDAIGFMRRVTAQDPISVSSRVNLALYLFLADRLDEALVEIRKAQAINPQLVADVHAYILIAQKRYPEALALAESWPDQPQRSEALALANHGLGRQAEADAALDALIRRFGDAQPYRVALVYAFRGQADEAFRWLEVAARPCDETRRFPIRCWYPLMQRSPLLKNLHADPRWADWLAGFDDA